MACSAIVHGIEPKEESLLKYLSNNETLMNSLSQISILKEDLLNTKLTWKIRGLIFEDGSKLEDWNIIESSLWHWQYDDHELSFDIYEHGGQYWKLYRERRVPMGTTDYDYSYGGLACRMAQVRYKALSRSPHSGILKDEGELEWVRVEEVDEEIHKVLKL